MASKVMVPSYGSFMDYLGAASPGSMLMLPTDPREIESICLSLDTSEGPGHDDVSSLFAQFVASEISVPPSRPINVCLEAGHFPVL